MRLPGLLCCTLLWAALHAAGAGAAQRIVSMHLCSDGLVLPLIQDERLLSVSWLSHDPTYSSVYESARRFRPNYGDVEEIIGLRPDLVLAASFSDAATLALLREHEVNVVEIPVAYSLDDVARNIGTVANAVGEPDLGQKQVRRLRDEWRQLSQTAQTLVTQPKQRALYLHAGGWMQGQPSLAHSILTDFGIENSAQEVSASGWGRVDLEQVVRLNPDILILSAAPGLRAARGHQLLQHPVLGGYRQAGRTLDWPDQLLSCGNLAALTAARRLLHHLQAQPAPSDEGHF